MPDDLYSTLGLAPGCTQEELKQAYRKLAKQYHPDVNRTPAADEMMRRINSAYSTLSDPEKRGLYDHMPSEEHSDHNSSGSGTSDDTDWGRYEEPPSAEGFRYANYAWEPPRYSFYKAAHMSRFGSPGLTKSYVFALAVIVIAMSYLLVLPFAFGTGTASSGIPTSGDGYAAGSTASPLYGLVGVAMVKGRVTATGSGMQTGDLSIAICDAKDHKKEYYWTVTQPGGYFQFFPVGNTAGASGDPEARYALRIRNNRTGLDVYSSPFGARPYDFVTQDISLS